MSLSKARPRPAATATARRPQSGPPLLVPVLSFTVLTVAATVANRATPRPDASGQAVLTYAQDHGGAIRLGAFLLFASAVPMALCAAVFYRRLRALGITAPGSAITLAGGLLASSALSACAVFAWAGGRLPAAAPPALARALADLSFLSGGPAFVAAYALLAAGISVTGLLSGLLPRALAWPGLALAVCGMLATLTLLTAATSPLSFLLPVVRFGGLVWLVVVAVRLPRTRPRTTDRPAPEPAAS